MTSIRSPKRVKTSTKTCPPKCTYKNINGHQCPNYVKHIYNNMEVCNVHLNTLKANEECTICLLPMSNPLERIKLSCGHYFHDECLGKCVKTECPVCRCELESGERRRVFLPVIAQQLEPVFKMSGSRQYAMKEIVGGIVEAVGEIGDEDLDVFRAHLSMLKFGAQTLRGRQFQGSSPAQVMYDWSMVMCSAFMHIATYGDYTGFSTYATGCLMSSTSCDPAFVQEARPQVGMIAPAASPELGRGMSPSPFGYVPLVRSPSPVLPWYYH